MIQLILTTDKLQLITDAAVTVDVHASFADYSGSTVTPGKQNTAITTATTTDILASPGASTFRKLKFMSARNKHATSSVIVTIQFNANATLYEIHKTTLKAGEMLEYVEGIGFFVMAATAKLEVTLFVASDVVNATTSFADITGLTIALKSGIKYIFQAELFHINNATTTGSWFGYNIGAAPTLAIIGTIDTVTASVTASVHSAGVVSARDTAITAQTTGSTSQRVAHIVGYIQPSADGTFAMRCASEVAVADGLTVKAGSWLWLKEVG